MITYWDVSTTLSAFDGILILFEPFWSYSLQFLITMFSDSATGVCSPFKYNILNFFHYYICITLSTLFCISWSFSTLRKIYFELQRWNFTERRIFTCFNFSYVSNIWDGSMKIIFLLVGKVQHFEHYFKINGWLHVSVLLRTLFEIELFKNGYPPAAVCMILFFIYISKTNGFSNLRNIIQFLAYI